MKVKEVNRTANIAWSPAPQYPIYLAAGTAAQQLDATFRYSLPAIYIDDTCSYLMKLIGSMLPSICSVIDHR